MPQLSVLLSSQTASRSSHAVGLRKDAAHRDEMERQLSARASASNVGCCETAESRSFELKANQWLLDIGRGPKLRNRVEEVRTV